MQGPNDTTTLQTTERSLRIIEALKELGPSRVEEIAEQTEISPSTAHRHLKTLQSFGYVVNQAGQYQVSLKFLTVSGDIRSRQRGYDLAKEMVYELAEQTGERVQFEVEEAGERVYLFTRAGESAVQADAKIGKRGPLHCSAAGKALLAELPRPRVREVVENQGLPQVTENTITDTEELFEELDRVREEGIAFNREESTPGLHAVGAPVTRDDGTVLGALSVAGPARRLSGERFTDDIPDLVSGVTQELELKIKYSNRS